MVNTERLLISEAEKALRDILQGELGFSVNSQDVHTAFDRGYDLLMTVTSGKAKFRVAVEVRSRITPQFAIDICHKLRRLPPGLIPVLYAPVVSPRVAEIAREEEVGYVDRAGNCRLQSCDRRLFIERRGFRVDRQPTRAAADAFSTKSSRIVRALLSRPKQGWQVRELASHPEVQVSPGLVVKVKRKLLEEGYAIEHDKLLHLRDPVGLLNAWAAKYAGSAEQIPLYFRGNTEAAEEAVTRWCSENGLRYALAGFSAAWRLAPEVRYNVAAMYVEDHGFEKALFDRLTAAYGGKRVESGANLSLWRPFDRSVFAFSGESDGTPAPVTSPLQTYLDLKRAAGRSEDAANAVYEKYLSTELQEAADRVKEWSSVAP